VETFMAACGMSACQHVGRQQCADTVNDFYAIERKFG
jgi:hypothetical protein